MRIFDPGNIVRLRGLLQCSVLLGLTHFEVDMVSESTEFKDILDCLIKKEELVSVDSAIQDASSMSAGIYAIFVESYLEVGSPFKEELNQREINLLYVGKAKNLQKRLIDQDLFGKGHYSTFFRSIGAVLSHRSEYGYLAGKSNQCNYSFH